MKRAMKVLITTDLYTTATNGVVTSVRNLSRELMEAGHEVKILTLSDTLHSHKEGNIYYIPVSYTHLTLPTKA